MAKPRIFISSTFYDLKQIRSDLDRFIVEMGYEPVRNETGTIVYGANETLESYCYKEINDIQILIGIIGGKFGTPSKENESYSITQSEIKTAISQGKQVYLFIEKNVLSEHQTYLLNKDNKQVKYHYVDNIKVYEFLEEILALPKNNTTQPFDGAEDIITFLKTQWAGLFRDLLIQQSNKALYGNINSKVNELTEVTSTLKTYLEEILGNVEKEKGKATELIQKERERLANLYIGKVVKDEKNNLYYIDKKRIFHLLPDKETALFLESNEGVIDIKMEDLIASYTKGNDFGSVLNDDSKLVWINKTHIFIVLDGKRFHVPSWDNLYNWKRTDRNKYIDITEEELYTKYPDGR